MSFTHVAASIGNLIGFVAGTALTWTSPELSKLENADETPLDKVYSKDSAEITWLGALMSLGAIFGPIIFGFLVNKIGRKWSILILAPPFILCYGLLAFSANMTCFLLARLVVGLGVGGVFTVLPMYLSEIATDANRGVLGASMNCFICFGIFFSYAVGPYMSWMYFNLLLTIFPCIFLPLFFIFAPETPHYLLGKGEYQAARESLDKLRGGESADELEVIKKMLESTGEGSFFEIFTNKGNKKALIMSLGLVGFQQFSGIDAVLFFAQDIFTGAGVDLAPEICSILVGLTQFGTSFVTPLLTDLLGRKILLVASAVGMLMAEVPLGLFFYLKDDDQDVSNIRFLPILCLIFYILTYNSGYGPLPWSVSAELFPSNVKSTASTFTASFCWFIGFLITLIFSSISNSIGSGPAFWIFSGFVAAAIPFSMFYVIETKGKNMADIQAILNK
ncbi:unnamed protein product [Brassicogethes aeneus]|uniref:Major facilitator superfamily (MFS) profile domain-containing protein n=1 Tax=Brassicogethes aeneus TaxID=1431903 RepID=A0A9P0FGZ5_BRAAE|nr:unnamed protein product [Brassicogethes aeneus]